MRRRELLSADAKLMAGTIPAPRHRFQLQQPSKAAAQLRPGKAVIAATPTDEIGGGADRRGGVNVRGPPAGRETGERSGGEGKEGATHTRSAIRPSRVVERLVKASPPTSLFLPPGSAECGRFPSQWPMQRFFRKVLCGDPHPRSRNVSLERGAQARHHGGLGATGQTNALHFQMTHSVTLTGSGSEPARACC